MKDIKFNFDLKTLGRKMTKSASWLFFAALLLLLVFEVLEVKTSVDIALSAGQTQLVPSSQKGVRIDFAGYQTIINRIQAAQNFTASTTIAQDPFSVPVPAGAPTQ